MRSVSGRVRPLACVALLAFAIGIAIQGTGALDGLERETLKARYDVRGAEPTDDVVVVAVDAKSFDVLRESWPFPRSLHARAVRRLHAAGAREIVYDVQFTEPTTPREDVALYEAIGDAGGAVLATSESDGRGHTDVLGGDANLRRVHARAAASDLSNDDAGAVTRFERSVGGLETLPVVAARRVGAPELPASAFGNDGAWIDYRGPPGSIRTVSFSDVVRGRADPSLFRGRIVVVGASAPTLRDVHSTPVGGDAPMAGPEVQANAIWTALHGAPLHEPSTLVGLVLVALLALVAPLVGLRLPAWAVGLAVPVAGGLFLVGAQLAFDAGLILDVVGPLAALFVGGVGTIAWSQLVVSRDNEVLERRVRERTQELWETQIEVLQRLGVRGRVARRRDRDAHRAHRPLLRAARPPVRHDAGRRRAAAPRERAARRGQGGHPRRDPLQAGTARRRRVGDDEDAHDDRREHPVGLGLAARPAVGDDRAHPPRALGRQRLPARAERRGDPARRAHLRDLRRLRRAPVGAPLQAPVAVPTGDRPRSRRRPARTSTRSSSRRSS